MQPVQNTPGTYTLPLHVFEKMPKMEWTDLYLMAEDAASTDAPQDFSDAKPATIYLEGEVEEC